MDFSFLAHLCQCDGTHICPLCKILTVVCLMVLTGILGYLVGKRKGRKASSRKEGS